MNTRKKLDLLKKLETRDIESNLLKYSTLKKLFCNITVSLFKLRLTEKKNQLISGDTQ